MKAIIKAVITPIIYILNIMVGAILGEKKAAVNIRYTGTLAPQLINVVIKTVTILSFLFLKVLAAIVAGMLQPKPKNKGIKDCPCKPNLCITLSIKKAALAI